VVGRVAGDREADNRDDEKAGKVSPGFIDSEGIESDDGGPF
jgi:hypothetical protein